MSQSQLRVAFDGDAVLFSDESERIVKAHGLDRFFEHEKAHENKPLAQVLHKLPRASEWLLRTCPWLEPNFELGPESGQVPSPSLQPSSLSPEPWRPSMISCPPTEPLFPSLQSHPPFEAPILSLSPSRKPLPLLCCS